MAENLNKEREKGRDQEIKIKKLKFNACLRLKKWKINLFFHCLVSVDFFLLSFLLYFPLFFVNFGGLSLPCYLLCCLLFVCFLLFVFLFFPSWIFCFFYLHRFSGVFCKFNCSWYFFTSSGHVPPWGLVAQRLRFEDGYRRAVSNTVDDLGKREA